MLRSARDLAFAIPPWVSARLAKQRERVMSVPSEIAIRAMNLPIFEPARLRREARRDQMRESSTEALPPKDRALVETLSRDGVCLTSLESLGLSESDAMFEEATGLGRLLQARSGAAEQAARPTLAASSVEMVSRARIMRWGLQPRLLDIVEAYLGEPAAFGGGLLYQSLADGREVGIRKWHRDREDERMVKIAIYLNDVAEDGGPFQVLTPELQRLVDTRASWRYAKYQREEQAISIRASDWATGVQTLTGPRGTMILTDTARSHHRGQPPVSRDRLALFFTYFTRRPRYPFFCDYMRLTEAQLTAFAASLPERERDCVLWRRDLPWRQRLIPGSRLTI